MQTAVACLGKELLPTEDRKNLSTNPTGWIQGTYPFLNYLYNRCHLIGFQLAGENDNPKNLMTGTVMLNVGTSIRGQLGMIDFENMIADYLKEFPNNHVMYRVEAIFEGDNLLASGIQLEAYSVEDNGAGICFNVYIYNVQDGVIIDYATGANIQDPNYNYGSGDVTIDNCTYVINGNNGKIHLPTCQSKPTTNAVYTQKTLEELLDDGHTEADFCKICKPQNKPKATSQ